MSSCFTGIGKSYAFDARFLSSTGSLILLKRFNSEFTRCQDLDIAVIEKPSKKGLGHV